MSILFPVIASLTLSTVLDAWSDSIILIVWMIYMILQLTIPLHSSIQSQKGSLNVLRLYTLIFNWEVILDSITKSVEIKALRLEVLFFVFLLFFSFSISSQQCYY